MEVNVLVIFYSRYGNTRTLAEAIAEGTREVKGAGVRIRRIDDLAPDEVIARDERWLSARKAMQEVYEEPTMEDMGWADAIFLGTCTRYGNPSAELKLFIDQTGPLWLKGALIDKIGSVFTTTGTPHGGNESTLIAMLNPLMHMGIIVVGPGYADPVMFSAGTPYGSSSVSGPLADQPPTEADLAVARFAGNRTTRTALIFKLGRDALGRLSQ